MNYSFTVYNAATKTTCARMTFKSVNVLNIFTFVSQDQSKKSMKFYKEAKKLLFIT